jgi:protein-tyrosine phosphatase
MFNKAVYNIINIARNRKTLNIVNKVARIDNSNMIIPNLYLGNISSANDIDFLQQNNIQAIINCTINEPFNDYFEDKNTFRLAINDSRDTDNISTFKSEIISCIEFIESNLDDNKAVYVHCYWGLMRSATVIAGYLIKKYNITHEDAIQIIKEQRPMAILPVYNFNEVLKYVELTYKKNDS